MYSFKAQRLCYRACIGGEVNTLYGGTTFFINGGFEIKDKHLLIIQTNYDSETGHRYKQFLGYARYNGNIWNSTLMYGRFLRKKEWYFASLSAGISYYEGHRKRVTKITPGLLGDTYTIQSTWFNGMGLSVLHEQMLKLDESFGLSLDFYAHWNSEMSVAGVALCLVFGDSK